MHFQSRTWQQKTNSPTHLPPCSKALALRTSYADSQRQAASPHPMYADCHPHEHVLDALHHDSIHPVQAEKATRGRSEYIMKCAACLRRGAGLLNFVRTTEKRSRSSRLVTSLTVGATRQKVLGSNHFKLRSPYRRTPSWMWARRATVRSSRGLPTKSKKS